MYLRCPDVCPIAMVRLGTLARNLADLIPGRLRVVSISIDGDPPAALHDMWLAHGSRAGWSMAALTDGPVEPTLKRLGIWMFRRPDGLINHGLDIFLLDPRGDVVDVLSPDEEPETIAQRLRSEMR
jgi:cytochrome oxidase Cu insertion factor (SCO1/SenC/PrrC family)